MRTPLPPETPLTQNIVITRLISDYGGTSLVYLARNGHYNVIIKEFYPSDSNCKDYMISRSENNCCIKTTLLYGKKSLEKFEDDKQHFIEQAQKAEIVVNSPDDIAKVCNYSSLYFFECTDITEDVKKTKGFEDTSSAYLLFSSKSGMTLDSYMEYISCDGKISLEQNLYITKSILLTLKYLHEEKNMLHLDLKPDNLFFSTDIKEPERTLCFLLDLEGIQPINKNIDILSVSDDFAPPEIMKIYEIKQEFGSDKGKLMSNTDYVILSENIGTYSDLYSVAACMYKMMMFGDSNYGRRWKECIHSAAENTKLFNLLKDDVTEKLNEKYPYLTDKITNMLFKGLYCLECNSAFSSKKLSEFRYCSCADFINDIDEVFDIINNQGFHAEVLLKHSYDMFAENYYFRKNASKRLDSTALINNDELYNQEWFSDIEEL